MRNNYNIMISQMTSVSLLCMNQGTSSKPGSAQSSVNFVNKDNDGKHVPFSKDQTKLKIDK